MIESEFLNAVPGWAKVAGPALATVVAGGLFLRQWLSNAKVDRTADESSIKQIQRLEAQLASEQARNDALMRERDEMAGEIGELRGEVTGLRAEVAAQRAQIETLLQLVKALNGGRL